MSFPKDIGGKELAKLLAHYGYETTRQTGSHIRLTTNQNGEHYITIPAHKPLRVGTLNSILSDVASHLGKEKRLLINELFD